MGLVLSVVAALAIGLGVLAGRWIVGRIAGLQGFRKRTNTEEDRGRPKLAFARAGASIVGIYLACVVLFMMGLSGGAVVVDETSMRVTVAKGGPADRAGIQTGDRVVSVNGDAATDWDTLKRLVGRHPDETIQVDIERDGAKKTIPVTTVGPKMMVGPFVDRRSLGGGELVAKSFVEPLRVVSGLGKGLARLFTATEKPELSGPVGISREAEAAERESTSTFLKLTAALTSYYGALASFALLVVALVMSVLPRRNSVLPTDGNSS